MTAFPVCTGLPGVRVDRVDHPSRCCTGPQATSCMGRASYELISPHLSYLFPTSLFLSHHSITLSFVSSRKFGFPADIVYPLRSSCTKVCPSHQWSFLCIALAAPSSYRTVFFVSSNHSSRSFLSFPLLAAQAPHALSLLRLMAAVV